MGIQRFRRASLLQKSQAVQDEAAKKGDDTDDDHDRRGSLVRHILNPQSAIHKKQLVDKEYLPVFDKDPKILTPTEKKTKSAATNLQAVAAFNSCAKDAKNKSPKRYTKVSGTKIEKLEVEDRSSLTRTSAMDQRPLIKRTTKNYLEQNK